MSSRQLLAATVFGLLLLVFSPPSRSRTDDLSWGVTDIQAPAVWDLGYRGQGVTIGLIDSGVDYNHPDLVNHIWINSGEDLNGNGQVDPDDWNGEDDDDNGYIDDLRGWDFEYNSSDVMDTWGFGTRAAGILVGDGTGGQQTGVAPEAKVMILKNYVGYQSTFWEAQQYALEMGADLIVSGWIYNWSFTPPLDYALFRIHAEIELAADVIHVNSIGGNGTFQSLNPLPFNIAAPANCPPPWLHPDQPLHPPNGVSSMLGSGAYGADQQIKDYSSRGPAAWNLGDILNLNPSYHYASSWPLAYNDFPYAQGGLIKPDLAAPIDVPTTALGGGYDSCFSDMSAPAAFTGGALALLLSVYPEASPDTLARILMLTATDMGPVGLDTAWGAGKINAYAAVMMLLQEVGAVLTGVVTDSSLGTPISGAEIELLGSPFSAQTDSLGHYLVVNIPAGSYDLRFSAPGFDTLIVPNLVLNLGAIETLSVALAGPHLQVDLTQITATLPWGDSLQIPLTVHNTGSSDLHVQFLKRGNWEPFDLYLSIAAQSILGDNNLFGVEVAAGSIWVTGANSNLEPNRLYRFSFSGVPQMTINQPSSPSTWGYYDLAGDGQYLYGSWGQTIEEVNLQGLLQTTIPGPLSLNRALAYDPVSDHFFAADNTLLIYEFNRQGTVIRSWNHSLHIQGLAWHPQGDSCPLFIFSQDGPNLLHLSKLNLTTGQIQTMHDFSGVSGQQAGGAAISGEIDPNRWCLVTLVQGTSDSVKVYSLEAYAPWLTTQPESQVIPPGGTLEAIVLLNASTVPPDQYGIDLIIQHNAAEPEVVIPCSLNVQPAGIKSSQSPPLPTAFAVGKPYPNPFNAEAVIPLALPWPAHVRIELFNVKGEMVEVIRDGRQEASWSNVRWQASGLASGLYFYRVVAQDLNGAKQHQQVGKIILLK